MNTLRKVLKYIKPYSGHATGSIILATLGSMFSLFSLTMAVPFLGILFKNQPMVTEPMSFSLNEEALFHNFNYFISQIILTQGERRALLVVSMIVVVLVLLKTLLNYFSKYIMTPLRNGIVKDIRNKLNDKVLALQLAFFTDEKKGDLIARMTGDVQEIEATIIRSLNKLIKSPITIIVYLLVLFKMSFSLTLFVLVLLPISAWIIGRIGKSLRRKSAQGQKKMGVLLAYIEETLFGLRIIKAFNSEERVNNRFKAENNSYTRVMNKLWRKKELASPLSELLSTGVIVVVMYYGGSLVLNNTSSMSPQVFITYLAIFSQIIPPAKELSSIYYNLQKGSASFDRVEEVINAKETIKESPQAISINDFADKIEYKNISFRYKENYVLKDINLTISKGKRVALVGQSGAGKSTLVDLLPRFYDVEKGEISIDGKNIRDLKIRDLRALMGIVSQESILFNDTIFNNIAFGVDDAKEKDVIAAAKVANAHEFIMQTEEGYQTNIGDRGNKLSGGQKQRISIARAVLKNPPIMILDEATSSLDTESEKLVQDALNKLMQNRTSIVIAHRLSTVRDADEICVLQEGQIVERGTHEALIELQGVYKKLNDLQMFA